MTTTTTTSTNAKYDMNRNPVYQIDCQMTKKGKTFAATKRRVCWRFGFANREAVEAGLTGTDCRGEEHEVVLVHSITSGKQLVLADGHEVHWSKSRRMFDKFECSWEMAGGHQLSVVAHASAPLFEKPGFRQFDLQIDGISFWDMPKMFTLGVDDSNSASKRIRSAPASSAVASLSTGVNNYDAFTSSQQEQENDLLSVASSTQISMYRSQPQLSSLGNTSPLSISPSPSMPDLLDLGGGYHHQALSSSPAAPTASFIPQAGEASPRSVMMNPFDLYVTPSLKHSLPAMVVPSHYHAPSMYQQQHHHQYYYYSPQQPTTEVTGSLPPPQQQGFQPNTNQQTIFVGY
jgi:hypothetical protein